MKIKSDELKELFNLKEDAMCMNFLNYEDMNPKVFKVIQNLVGEVGTFHIDSLIVIADNENIKWIRVIINGGYYGKDVDLKDKYFLTLDRDGKIWK